MAPVAHAMSDEGLRQVGDIAEGVVVRAERALSRREGWLVDVEGGDGVIRPLFVRVARDGDPMNSLDTLQKEAQLAGALVRAGIEVAPLVGRDPTCGSRSTSDFPAAPT